MIVEDLRILLWCASAAARLIAADRLILATGQRWVVVGEN